MQKHQWIAHSQQSVFHYHDDCDHVDGDGGCDDDDHFGEDDDDLQMKVNAGVQDLQTQRGATGRASNKAKDQGSPMAGPGWRKMPSKTTPASSKTSRTRYMRTRTMTLHSITQFSNKLRMTKTRTTDV